MVKTRLTILLGIFQSSHYDSAIFRAWIGRHPRPEDWDEFKKNAPVVWSWKAKILFVSSITFSRFLPAALIWNERLLRFPESLAAGFLVRRARSRLERSKLATVIGITGSFGKTTTKEIIARILEQKFRVHRTPENTNTLLGVARWILRTEFADGDAVIVEMGAYRRGDIRLLCSMVRPVIGILTGLNEAHRERFGSLENAQAAKCELFDALPAGGTGIWNSDSRELGSAIVKRRASWERRGIAMVSYGVQGAGAFRVTCALVDETSIRVRIASAENSSLIAEEKISGAGVHVAGPISAAAVVAGLLAVSPDQIARGLRAIRPQERRFQMIRGARGRLIVDDSYNITIDGVRAALAMFRSMTRRKIAVFAGIPEGGRESKSINRELGRMIAGVFDVILLRETPVAGAIRAGLEEKGFHKSRIIAYTQTNEVEEALRVVAQDGDCIYFSAYDWPPIYL